MEDGNHGNDRPRPDEFVSSGMAFIRAADMANRRIDFAGADKITETAERRIRKGFGRPLDVLLSHKGTVGRVALAPADSPAFVCSPQTTYWRSLDHQAIDPGFLRYYLESPSFTRQLATRSGETDMAPYVSLTEQRKLNVLVPPIEVQRAIAATLGALDDKIESNRRLVDYSSDLLDAIAAQVSSDLPPVPLGGLVEQPRDSVNPVRLGDAIVEHFSLPAFDAGGIPERVQASTILSSKLLLVRRSILVGRLNPRFNRTWWVTPDAELPALASPEFLCLQAVDDEALAALWLAVRTDAFRAELAHRVTGTSGSHQRVRPEDAVAIEVPDVGRLARETKARALALLKAMEQKRQESERLAALRDALLPELLTGRIRVPEAAEAGADGTTSRRGAYSVTR